MSATRSNADDQGTGDRASSDRRLLDIVLALSTTLAVALVIAADLDGTGRAHPAAYLFALGFGALMLVRRSLPRLVLALTVLGIFVYYALQFPPIGIALPAVAALYSAAEVGRTAWAVGSGAVLVAVAAYFRILEGLPAAYLLSYELLTNVALVAAAVALGVSVRLRRETRLHQERLRAITATQQAHEAERRMQAERVRIARDLHDVVGHTMSVIAVHGNVADEALGRDNEAARRALDQIRQAAQATMNELRATVKILRAPGTDIERGAVGIAGLSRLADAAREAGIEVDLRVDVPDDLDGAVDAAAYRIVQESLTNGTGQSGVNSARRLRPDFVLMDIRMPQMDGLETTRQIVADRDLAAVKVLVLITFDEDELVVEAIRSGAAGYLLKDVSPG